MILVIQQLFFDLHGSDKEKIGELMGGAVGFPKKKLMEVSLSLSLALCTEIL